MWAYIARRLLLAIPTLFVVTVVAFFIVMLEPKQPIIHIDVFRLLLSGTIGIDPRRTWDQPPPLHAST